MFSNQSVQPVRVKAPRKGQVSMQLPRSDDGKVHEACGMRSNGSAAHFADAQAGIAGGAAGMKMPLSQGN